MLCFQPPVFGESLWGWGRVTGGVPGGGSSLSSSVEHEERKGILGPSLLKALSLNNVESWEEEGRRV